MIFLRLSLPSTIINIETHTKCDKRAKSKWTPEYYIDRTEGRWEERKKKEREEEWEWEEGQGKSKKEERNKKVKQKRENDMMEEMKRKMGNPKNKKGGEKDKRTEKEKAERLGQVWRIEYKEKKIKRYREGDKRVKGERWEERKEKTGKQMRKDGEEKVLKKRVYRWITERTEIARVERQKVSREGELCLLCLPSIHHCLEV